jgi:hypothetical protein
MKPETDLLHVARPRPCNTQQIAPIVQQPTQRPRNKAPSLKDLASGILSKSRETASIPKSEECNSPRNTDATSLLHDPIFSEGVVQHAQQPPEPIPSPLTGMECSGCDHLEMRDEILSGTRRRFWWRCRLGYELLEGRRYGERVTISPPECNQFTQWNVGAK